MIFFFTYTKLYGIQGKIEDRVEMILGIAISCLILSNFFQRSIISQSFERF
jgi:hypothetical protein